MNRYKTTFVCLHIRLTLPPGNDLTRHDSMLSHVTDSTLAGEYPWQQKPVALWDSDDVIDWLDNRKFDDGETSRCLSGKFMK